MPLSRREFLERLAALGALAAAPHLVACDDGGSALPVYTYDGEPGPADLFVHGVASGDPLPDGVVLWTRVSPTEQGPVDVFWEVATDAGFAHRVGAGWVQADEQGDYTVKLDATGLQPGTDYHYRFQALGRVSRVGRTRTAPEGPTERVGLAVVSCSNYVRGYFHGYRSIAARDDVEIVVHLGDYIYDGGSDPAGGSIRPHEPDHSTRTLSDYRTRYAQYRRDPDLQALHARHPFIVVWDDHEIANNTWKGGIEGDDDPDGTWPERRAAAMQAWFEWIPMREQPGGRIFRSFALGDLVDLVMLDTRNWGRDLQAEDPNGPEVRDPERTILGQDQEQWLTETLVASTATWRLLGQQVLVGQFKVSGAPLSEGGGSVLNADSWDGYAAARTRLFDLLASDAVADTVVLSGDIHMSFALELTEDPNNPDAYDPTTGRGALAVELVTPGITSPGGPEGSNDVALPIFLPENPHIQWLDMEHRGYMSLEVTRARIVARWHHFEDIEQPETPETIAAVFAVELGTPHLLAMDT
ncbi:MAG: alkaline phosphatase D family protein [Deltaproteobacteria bacterium]|nr:alkaline phosphatase D family protein [Deltaproteobacteria bacterium]